MNTLKEAGSHEYDNKKDLLPQECIGPRVMRPLEGNAALIGSY
jgi:hypothetical protein